MKGNGHPSTSRVFIYFMAAALAGQDKTNFFQDPNYFRGSDPGGSFGHREISREVRLTDSKTGIS
jgi:hypothetical protein